MNSGSPSGTATKLPSNESGGGGDSGGGNSLMKSSKVTKDDKDSDSDGEGAEEILEESPCKRWSKRREQVKQRDVPGIDCAYLAMDNETGNEVVWNEVLFSERKNYRLQEEQISAVFEKLTHLVHTNLVKFHKYWADLSGEKPRIIFITEYMSSGNLARFLQNSRKSGSRGLSAKTWKKWTTQILSALNYLHSCNPPIVHGNLTCNTIFIQHNGSVKIGCVAPTAIHHHVKTVQENIKCMHYIAPEYANCNAVKSPADIYSFGICALEMALPHSLCGTSNGSSESNVVSEETIKKNVDSLEDPRQRDFIERCLVRDPAKRPTARELLFHTILFEVHSLKLLAAHRIVSSKLTDSLNEDDLHVSDPERIAAVSKYREMALKEVPSFQVDLEKFIEDVGNGIYPVTAFAPLAHQKMTASTSSSVIAGEQQADDRGGSDAERPGPTPSPPTESPVEYKENRAIIKAQCKIVGSYLTLVVQLDDMMNRQLTAEVNENDTPSMLAAELVQHGLISEKDEKTISEEIASCMKSNKERAEGGDQRSDSASNLELRSAKTRI